MDYLIKGTGEFPFLVIFGTYIVIQNLFSMPYLKGVFKNFSSMYEYFEYYFKIK